MLIELGLEQIRALARVLDTHIQTLKESLEDTDPSILGDLPSGLQDTLTGSLDRLESLSSRLQQVSDSRPTLRSELEVAIENILALPSGAIRNLILANAMDTLGRCLAKECREDALQSESPPVGGSEPEHQFFKDLRTPKGRVLVTTYRDIPDSSVKVLLFEEEGMTPNLEGPDVLDWWFKVGHHCSSMDQLEQYKTAVKRLSYHRNRLVACLAPYIPPDKQGTCTQTEWDLLKEETRQRFWAEWVDSLPVPEDTVELIPEKPVKKLPPSNEDLVELAEWLRTHPGLSQRDKDTLSIHLTILAGSGQDANARVWASHRERARQALLKLLEKYT